MRVKVLAKETETGTIIGVWADENSVRCAGKTKKARALADAIRPALEQCADWEAVLDFLYNRGMETYPVRSFRRLVQ